MGLKKLPDPNNFVVIYRFWAQFFKEFLFLEKFGQQKIDRWSTKYVGRIKLPWSGNNFDSIKFWVEKYFWVPN